MAFTFRIVFSGLCAFIPKRSFTDPEPQSVLALLPNALKAIPLRSTVGGVGGGPEGDLILPPHYPLLLFDMKNLRQGRDPMFFFVKETSDSSRVRCGVTPLVRSDVMIRPDGRDASLEGLRLINRSVNDPSRPTADDLDSLFWLKKIDELNGTVRRIESRFDGPLDDDEDEIVTRIRLTTGRLRTFELSGPKWQYLEIDDPIENPEEGQRVATKLALEFEAEDMVKIVFRDFGSTTLTKLIFAPPADEPYEDVEIQIQNLEPERLLDIPMEDENEPAPLIDPDFSIYYGLLDGLLASDPRPVPRRSVPDGAGRISGDGKPCSPAGMNG